MSAVVVAVCAVVLTTKAMTTGLPLVVHQGQTFDSGELAKRVHQIVLERQDLGGVSQSMTCPENVPIEKDTAFGCSVLHEGRYKTVRAVVVDAESGAIEVGQLSG